VAGSSIAAVGGRPMREVHPGGWKLEPGAGIAWRITALHQDLAAARARLEPEQARAG
jgi:hypothetical protein